MVWVTAALAITLSACGDSAVGGTVTAEANSPTIAAKGLKFDRTELDVPAARRFTLVFNNEDSAPHNVAIYRDASATDRLFLGDVIGGSLIRVYAVPQLPVGTWYFRCDVHTEMHGQIVASAGA